MGKSEKIVVEKFTFTNVRLLVLLISLFALWGVLYLGVTSETALTGQHVRELQDEYDRTMRENQKLEYDMAVLMQPTRIAERATQIGLAPIPSSRITYIWNLPYRVAPQQFVRLPSLTPTPARIKSFSSWFWNFLARIGLGDGNQSAEAEANP